MELFRRGRRRRLGRRRHPVAFVFSGGGPLGAVQVGLIQALFAEGIFPDVVVGVSVGAFNAVYVAQEPSPSGAEELREVWMRMRRDDLFPGGRLVTAWHALRRGSYVYSNLGLRRLIETEVAETTFEELKIPAHVVAANLETGREAWFSSGPFLEPLLASAAMPGVFSPVVIDGVAYIDGGVVNNVPISRAIEAGARRVYVLNTSGATQMRDLTRPHDFMMHGMVLARGQRYRHDLEHYRLEAEVIEFPAVEVGHVPFTNLSQTPRLIEAGFDAGLKFLRGEAPTAGGLATEETG